MAIEAAAKIKLHGKHAAESIAAIGEELIGVRTVFQMDKHADETFTSWVRAEFNWSPPCPRPDRAHLLWIVRAPPASDG